MIDDFRDMLRALVAAEVRFLVVDAHSLGVHGVPRATGDLDIWVQRSPGNASRLIAGLADFGAPVVDLGIRAEDFVQPDIVAQLGLPPYRIDLLTSISGVQFEDAWAGRVEAEIEGVRVPVLGMEALVLTKRATGRRKDLADLDALGEE